jgi:hypothetical protein
MCGIQSDKFHPVYMEFEAIAFGEKYKFSPLSNNSFLISGSDVEYILYNNGDNWKCADEVDNRLLSKLGKIIDSTMHHLS